MTGADWLTAIEMYKPTVRIVEVNVPRVASIRIKGERWQPTGAPHTQNP